MKAYEIILEQLGGNKIVAMTGARLLHDGDNKLIASIKGSKKYNQMDIILNDLDLYDLTFRKIAGAKRCFALLKEDKINGVYCDQLKEIIEKETGLYLSF